MKTSELKTPPSSIKRSSSNGRSVESPHYNPLKKTTPSAEEHFKSKRFIGNTKLKAVLEGKHVIRFGATGREVGLIQQALLAQGVPLWKFGADEKFSSETRAAVIYFQRLWNLKITGQIDSTTLKSLDFHDPQVQLEKTALEKEAKEVLAKLLAAMKKKDEKQILKLLKESSSEVLQMVKKLDYYMAPNLRFKFKDNQDILELLEKFEANKKKEAEVKNFDQKSFEGDQIPQSAKELANEFYKAFNSRDKKKMLEVIGLDKHDEKYLRTVLAPMMEYYNNSTKNKFVTHLLDVLGADKIIMQRIKATGSDGFYGFIESDRRIKVLYHVDGSVVEGSLNTKEEGSFSRKWIGKNANFKVHFRFDTPSPNNWWDKQRALNKWHLNPRNKDLGGKDIEDIGRWCAEYLDSSGQLEASEQMSLTGFASFEGPPIYNKRLGYSRIYAIKKWLDIFPNTNFTFSVMSYGEEKAKQEVDSKKPSQLEREKDRKATIQVGSGNANIFIRYSAQMAIVMLSGSWIADADSNGVQNFNMDIISRYPGSLLREINELLSKANKELKPVKFLVNAFQKAADQRSQGVEDWLKRFK